MTGSFAKTEIYTDVDVPPQCHDAAGFTNKLQYGTGNFSLAIFTTSNSKIILSE